MNHPGENMAERPGPMRPERALLVAVRTAPADRRARVSRLIPAGGRVFLRGWVWLARALATSGVIWACPMDLSRVGTRTTSTVAAAARNPGGRIPPKLELL
jgi:hypothetical protein